MFPAGFCWIFLRGEAMRQRNFPAIFILFLLSILLFSSCDAVIPIIVKAQKKKMKEMERYRQTHEGLASLRPPYKPWNWSKEKNKISVHNAIYAITEQVGVYYNRDKSYKNTDPLCRRWITPDFKDVPWREAMDGTLAIPGLKWVMEDNEVILLKKEDYAKREQEIQRLKTELTELISDFNPKKLPDAVIVFPLLDSSGRTSELGALMAELGMLKAVYVPQKVFNLHAPSIIDLFGRKNFFLLRKSISDKEREEIIHYFDAQNFAIGRLEFKNGRYEARLTFDGRSGARDFSFSAAEQDLFKIPQWIARCVHEYCKTTLSAEQRRYMDMPDIGDTASLLRLVELERDFENHKRNLSDWNRLLESNPDSMHLLYRIHYICRENWPDESLDIVNAALDRNKENDFLRVLQANAYHGNDDCFTADRLYCSLIKGDFPNAALYDWLDTGLLRLGLGKEAEAIYQAWERHDPDSSIQLLEKGDFYLSYAWNARGGGWSGSVAKANWQLFEERLHVAEAALVKALELNPDNPEIGASLIKVAMGLGYDRERMEEWFEAAVKADPTYFGAYRQKLIYLMPKWRGDSRGRQMFAFARECAVSAPEGSRVSLLILDVHRECAYRWADRHNNDWKSYYQNPTVYEEVKEAYQKYLQERPDENGTRNKLAEIAVAAQDYEEAVRQFEIIGDNRDESVWKETQFNNWKKEAYEKAPRKL
jgi:tetratricopeptide (TPR) repeat protein